MAILKTMLEATGLRELNASLDLLDDKVRRTVTRRGLRAGAKFMLPAIRAGAPRGKTMRLSESFQVTGGGRTKNGIVSVMIQVGKRFFKGNTFYAGFINFGWRVGRRSKVVKAFTDAVRSAKGRKRATLGQAPADSRKQIPGKHFVDHASAARAQGSVNVITATIAEEFKIAVNQSKKGS